MFVVWSLSVYGLTKGAFRSFIGLEFKNWFRKKYGGLTGDVRRLQWELKHNSIWDERIVHDGDALAERVRLTHAERNARMKLMDAAQKKSRPFRAVNWFFDCPFCQGFGVACVFGLFGSWGGVFVWFANALAYATSTALIARAFQSQKTGDATGCPSCG